MPGNFSYLSILNPGFTAPASTSNWSKAGEFAYVSFLNPPATGAVTTTTGTATTTTTNNVYYLSNANNVSFGTAGSVVTASASYTYGHVAAPRPDAWSELGVFVGTTSPGPGVVYSDWVGGSSGYFMWIMVP